MLSQILRFTLPSSLTISAPAFLKFRQHVSAAGAKSQYFGYVMSTKAYPLPKKRHEICWVIQWPDDSDICERASLVAELDDISQRDATTLLLKFEDTQLQDLATALEAPVCEFAVIRLSSDAPLFDAAFCKSMHKTYTDCYKMQGFTGGNWGYSLNTNDSGGLPLALTRNERLAGEGRRLAVYYLGWESIELHQDASATPLFAEEIDKLKPWFGPGTGAWYVTFRKHE